MVELHYPEEKLKYLFKSLNLVKGEIAKKLEFDATTVAKIQNSSENRLKKYHIYAICHAYDIPIEIFENENIKTTEEIDTMIALSQKKEKIFRNNYELLNKLVGTWYFYSYQGQNSYDIWQTTTTIDDDFATKDTNGNIGELFIGQNQSVILKETRNAKNLNAITFDNNRITYRAFPFSRTSKVNALNDEILSFGVCSRVKLNYQELKEILGDAQKVQLHINHDMLRRIYRLHNKGK